ncbi:Carboxymethylenebutenolidase [Candidatus Koribacter versatilis Ellin345]|uniref:Carboxymethylenebutenolidase n=1 Tax=Koribacter versatilis (strain Ellin345) TaxID=204669 RepID=Q1IMW2_KORVE|nr:dienelactone hydrolase family protein [Candidatus Koribacter versatilis]ABF41788.1 Carboxymethylenebutenolidase [Candidatus Koribacter versatilis Ellin345]
MKVVLEKTLVVMIAALLLSCATFAATPKEVTYKSGNDTVKAILYAPDGAKGKLPALVVIHEWWGLNDWVKEQASKLADQGYVTLAIDLYRGGVAKTSDEAHELMRGVPNDRASRDLTAAAEFLRSQPNVDASRVGDIGWCMGGGYALDLALSDAKLKASVINYGHLMVEPSNLAKINAAVLGLFGAQDRGIPVDSVKAFGDELKKQGKTVEIKIYDDAGHAFENPNNKDGYRAADAEDAWKRTTAFLEKNLKGK